MKVKKLLAAILIMAVTIGICAIVYIKTTNTKLVIYQEKYKLLNGVDKELLEDMIMSNEVKLNESEESISYTYEKLNLEISNADELLEKLLKSFKINLDDVDLVLKTSDTTVNKLVKLNSHRTENRYAELKIEDNSFVVTEEVIGNKLNIDNLVEALDKKLAEDGKYGVTLQLNDYYIPFDSTHKSKVDYQTELDRYNNFSISYTNGFKITPEDIIKYLDVREGTIVFKEDMYETAVSDMDNLIDIELASYDTVGGNWEFTTTGGETITVSGGTWGDYFDSAKESKYIVEQIKELNNETDRCPIKKRDYADTIKDRYIEISIDEQHLWVYDKGELIMETPVVTGTKNKHDTPKGVYFISQKTDGTYLRGEDYKTWVNKWMRITDRGHGLHDATWRSTSQFGGKTYTYNGSHGCINLPNKFAYKLYDFIKIHDCVVIY